MSIKIEKESKGPERRCALTGEVMEKSKLLRFVLSPDNVVTPDIKGKLPGRGVWVTAKHSSIKEAVKRKTFHRGFAKDIKVGPEIEKQVEDLLEKAAMGRLKLANKSGLAIYGFTKLMAAIEKESIIALFHAREASMDTAEKLDYKFRTKLEQSGILEQGGLKNPCYCFKTEELSLAFGQANVIHAGLKTGGASIAMIEATQKLITYNDS
ncbi:MAG: RNA-binding protein [Rhizobiales bacterium]|nr:RNA-binding protein [Hyphomicrobiales bacterium]